MIYQFDDTELTKEKSLWSVYVLSRKINSNPLHIFIVMGAMLLLGINAFGFNPKLGSILASVREWAVFGFTFSISTLGFLISGFTIFATLSKPKMLLAMMEYKDSKTGIPILKCNFFAFMNVFIAYLVFSGIYLSVILLGSSAGFMSNIIALLHQAELTKEYLIKLTYVFCGSSFAYLLLILKTFIFNIYAIVMNFLRWEYRQP